MLDNKKKKNTHTYIITNCEKDKKLALFSTCFALEITPLLHIPEDPENVRDNVLFIYLFHGERKQMAKKR